MSRQGRTGMDWRPRGRGGRHEDEDVFGSVVTELLEESVSSVESNVTEIVPIPTSSQRRKTEFIGIVKTGAAGAALKKATKGGTATSTSKGSPPLPRQEEESVVVVTKRKTAISSRKSSRPQTASSYRSVFYERDDDDSDREDSAESEPLFTESDSGSPPPTRQPNNVNKRKNRNSFFTLEQSRAPSETSDSDNSGDDVSYKEEEEDGSDSSESLLSASPTPSPIAKPIRNNAKWSNNSKSFEAEKRRAQSETSDDSEDDARNKREEEMEDNDGDASSTESLALVPVMKQTPTAENGNPKKSINNLKSFSIRIRKVSSDGAEFDSESVRPGRPTGATKAIQRKSNNNNNNGKSKAFPVKRTRVSSEGSDSEDARDSNKEGIATDTEDSRDSGPGGVVPYKSSASAKKNNNNNGKSFAVKKRTVVHSETSDSDSSNEALVPVRSTTTAKMSLAGKKRILVFDDSSDDDGGKAGSQSESDSLISITGKKGNSGKFVGVRNRRRVSSEPSESENDNGSNEMEEEHDSDDSEPLVPLRPAPAAKSNAKSSAVRKHRMSGDSSDDSDRESESRDPVRPAPTPVGKPTTNKSNNNNKDGNTSVTTRKRPVSSESRDRLNNNIASDVEMAEMMEDEEDVNESYVSHVDSAGSPIRGSNQKKKIIGGKHQSTAKAGPKVSYTGPAAKRKTNDLKGNSPPVQTNNAKGEPPRRSTRQKQPVKIGLHETPSQQQQHPPNPEAKKDQPASGTPAQASKKGKPVRGGAKPKTILKGIPPKKQDNRSFEAGVNGQVVEANVGDTAIDAADPDGSMTLGMEIMITEDAEEYATLQNAVPGNKAIFPSACLIPEKAASYTVPQSMIHKALVPGVTTSIAKVECSSGFMGFVTVAAETVMPFEVADMQRLMVVLKGEISVKTTAGFQFNETTGEYVLFGKTLTPGCMFTIPVNCQYTLENWTKSETLLGYYDK